MEHLETIVMLGFVALIVAITLVFVFAVITYSKLDRVIDKIIELLKNQHALHAEQVRIQDAYYKLYDKVGILKQTVANMEKGETNGKNS